MVGVPVVLAALELPQPPVLLDGALPVVLGRETPPPLVLRDE